MKGGKLFNYRGGKKKIVTSLFNNVQLGSRASKFLVKFLLNPDKIGLQGFTEPAPDKWACMMPLSSTSSGTQTAENGDAGKTSPKTVVTGLTAKMERPPSKRRSGI